VDLSQALLDSWDRQCRIVDNLAAAMSPELLQTKPDPEGWTVAHHLAHIHTTRRYWHMLAAGLEQPVGPSLFTVVSDEEWVPSSDIDEIRGRLAESGSLVRSWVAEQIEAGTQRTGNYEHPVLYLQHMVWHEGWHAALLMLAMRRAGQEPSEEWECANIWNLWRDPD
jgi:uncharacterized damage-inducible protein DinB